MKVQSLLEQSGATVILTRSDENGIYDLDKKTLREKKVSDIKNRVKIGNEAESDIFVSIHLNKIPQSQYSGWQTFYKKNNENSMKLAKTIQANLNESIQKENKREALAISDKYIVDHVEIPIAIVECGFLSNPTEEKLLQTDEYQNKLAWGIYTRYNSVLLLIKIKEFDNLSLEKSNSLLLYRKNRRFLRIQQGYLYNRKIIILIILNITKIFTHYTH